MVIGLSDMGDTPYFVINWLIASLSYDIPYESIATISIGFIVIGHISGSAMGSMSVSR